MKDKILYLEPVSKKISTDFITPVLAYSLFKNDRYSFLLESAQKGRTGRYSILGFSPRKVYEINDNKVSIYSRVKRGYKITKTVKTKAPLDIIDKVSSSYRIKGNRKLAGFSGGLVGYAGYEMIGSWEDIDFTKVSLENVPSALFMFIDEFIVFDHLYNIAQIIKLIDEKDSCRKPINRIDEIIKKLNSSKMPVCFVPEETGEKVKYTSNFTKAEFIKSVKKTKEYIKDGDIIQGVLSQRFTVPVSAEPFNYYRALRMINPSPYMFYLKMADIKLCGSSPEVMAKVTGRNAVVRPIAGTRRRSLYKDRLEEKRLSRDLKSDKKEQAEHTMLVDLARNDLSRVCVPGTVKALNLMSVEKFSHVMHMVTDVGGRMKKAKRNMDLFKAAFPAGTVSGAPKLRAIKIIDRIEPAGRGPYAGAVGYLSFDGDMDTAIIIRTMLIKGKKAIIQAGAGIVADSVPEKEYKETINKAKALFEAVTLGNKLKEEEVR